MENQHRMISGYRELTENEIDLMNRVKAMEAELLALTEEVAGHVDGQYAEAMHWPGDPEARAAEMRRLHRANPALWRNEAMTHFQIGFMCLVRAVAQPDSPMPE